MNEEEYIEQRVDDQILWYSNKSGWNQKVYKRLRVLEIVCAASIPFLVSHVTAETVTLKVVVGVLGVCVAVVSGAVALYKFHENWVQYRSTSESLKHEKFLFLTKTEPYDIDESYPLFVQRIEFIISNENSNWSQYIGKTDEKADLQRSL
ncbi:MAG: DUF4231 domain-containing protein [Gammaproteobacteria bacterium]|nr:DUF4231 domain-containing protein [Gammaproteobacteria bacterium]